MKSRFSRFSLSIGRTLIQSSAIVCISFSATSSLFAQTYSEWTNTGTNWTTGSNWTSGNGSAYGQLEFKGNGNATSNNDFGSLSQWRIYFNGTKAYTLGGNSVSLLDFGNLHSWLLSDSTANQAINLNVNFAATTGNTYAQVSTRNTGNLTLNTLGITGSVVSQARFVGESTGTITVNGAISGTSKDVVIGVNQAGTDFGSTNVTFNGANSYSGQTFVSTGTLNLGSGSSMATSAFQLGQTGGSAGATLNLASTTGGQNYSNSLTVRSGSSGTKTISSANSSGTNTLSGAVTMNTDLTTLVNSSGGTLAFSSGVNVGANKLTVLGSGSTTINNLTSSLTLGGFLVKQGSGTLTLSGTSNSYTGTNSGTLNANGTQINAGTLAIAADTSLGLAPAGAYNNVQFTGSSTLRSDASISLHVNRSISITSGATASFDSNGNTFTVNGVVNGTGGALTKIGAGTLVLSNSSINTYTGATTVTTGTLQLDGSTHASSTVGIGTAGTLSGTGTVNGNATLTGNGIINKSSGTIVGTLGVTGGNWNGSGAVTGIVTSSSGLFIIGNGANLTANGNLNVTGGTIAAGNSASTITGSVNYTSSSNSTFAGVIAGSGKTLTVNNGSATLILSGNNTYSGITSVSAGTLLVNGTNSGSGAVNVSSGALLGGSGSLAGTVNITGTLAPGTSIESLGTGAVNFMVGSTFAYELNSAALNGDLVDSTGTLDIASTTTLTLTQLASGILANGSKLTLISYLGGWTSGELFSYDAGAGLATLADDSTITLGANQWLFNYNDTSGGLNFSGDQSGATSFVTMTVIPEPASALIGGIGVLFMLRRRRN
jgi:fibronectin-binding autotransporter adhesin